MSARRAGHRGPRGRTARSLLAALIAFAITPAGVRAQHPLAYLPLGDPAYVQLAALDRQGCAPARVSPDRPYTIADVRDAIVRFDSSTACGGPIAVALSRRFGTDSARWRAEREDVRVGGSVTLQATGLGRGEFRPLWADVRPTNEGTPPAVGIVRGRATFDLGDHAVAVTEAFAQTDVRNDPHRRARAFRRTSGTLDFSEAYINGQVGRLVVSLGRMPEAWLGEGEESLVLSAHGPPIDRLEASARWKTLEAHALLATISDVVLDTLRDSLPSGTPPQRYHRFLVGHTLTWTPTRAVELTLGETALLARGLRVIDLAYVNPMMPYIVTQNDTSFTGRDQHDNLTTFGALRLRAGPLLLHGELLIDDIQIDPRDRKRIPDQLGWWGQATVALPLAVPTSATLEYRRLDSYTYMRRWYSEVYQQYDVPLGSELGPDADLLQVGGEVLPVGTLRLSGHLGVWRHGALRIDQRPAQQAEGHAGEPFPSTSTSRPDVQKALLGDLGIQFLTARLPVTARLELARITNVNNQPVPAALYLRMQLLATYAFRYP